MSLRAPRLLPRDHGWIQTNRGLERGHRLITYTMRPDRQIPAHAALWEIRMARMVARSIRRRPRSASASGSPSFASFFAI